MEYNGVRLADRERISKLRDRLTDDCVEVKEGNYLILLEFSQIS